MGFKILPPENLIYDVLNDNYGCEQRLLDFYGAYIKAVSYVMIYTDIGNYKERYIAELEDEIRNRIVIKLPVLSEAVRDKLNNGTLYTADYKK